MTISQSHLFKLLIALLTATALSACNTISAPRTTLPAAPTSHVEESIEMPSNFNTVMLKIIDEGRRVRIYTQMNNIGDPQHAQLLFPSRVARSLGLTNKQMNRRFMDLLLQAKRFEIFDPDYTVTMDGALQQWAEEDADIVIDCMVTEARQEMINIRPYKKVRTQVKISVQMKDMLTGKNLFDGNVAVNGVWGDVQGEGTLIEPGLSINDPAKQSALGGDYERALSKAFEEAVNRIDQIMRPVGAVTLVTGKSLSMFGGVQHGFQSGDGIVVFRAHSRIMGDGRERIVGVQPLASARCKGVGSDISQCTILQVEPGEQIKETDYTVLTDQAAQGRRIR